MRPGPGLAGPLESLLRRDMDGTFPSQAAASRASLSFPSPEAAAQARTVFGVAAVVLRQGLV